MVLCYAPTGANPAARDCAMQVGYLRYAAARDVNLAVLRYVAEAVRIRLFALRYTTTRRGFFGYAAYRFISARRNLNLIIRRS